MAVASRYPVGKLTQRRLTTPFVPTVSQLHLSPRGLLPEESNSTSHRAAFAALERLSERNLPYEIKICQNGKLREQLEIPTIVDLRRRCLLLSLHPTLTAFLVLNVA